MFERNVLDAVVGAADGDPQATEEAQEIFLRFKERDRLKAEKCAYAWAEKIRPFLSFALPLASAPTSKNPHAALSPGETEAAVARFIKERHVRQYFPNHSVVTQ